MFLHKGVIFIKIKGETIVEIISTIDTSIYNVIIKLMSTNITFVMTVISHLGSAVTLITLAIGFILLLKNKKDSRFIILNLILVFLLNRLLKFIIARPRPEVLKLVKAGGYSFPSGHSMISFGFYGFLIYLVYKNIKNKKIKYPLMIFLSAIILLIGISRVYLGAHYATDVIGGFVIGFIYLIVFIKYLYKRK